MSKSRRAIIKAPSPTGIPADYAPAIVAQIPWTHHILLMEKVKDPAARLWYMQQTIANGWSRPSRPNTPASGTSTATSRTTASATPPTIGLILCQDKNRLVAEYALKGVKTAIGVSQYQLTRALPRRLQSSLPTIEQIETELSALAAKPRTDRQK